MANCPGCLMSMSMISFTSSAQQYDCKSGRPDVDCLKYTNATIETEILSSRHAYSHWDSERETVGLTYLPLEISYAKV